MVPAADELPVGADEDMGLDPAVAEEEELADALDEAELEVFGLVEADVVLAGTAVAAQEQTALAAD